MTGSILQSQPLRGHRPQAKSLQSGPNVSSIPGLLGGNGELTGLKPRCSKWACPGFLYMQKDPSLGFPPLETSFCTYNAGRTRLGYQMFCPVQSMDCKRCFRVCTAHCLRTPCCFQVTWNQSPNNIYPKSVILEILNMRVFWVPDSAREHLASLLLA